MLWKAEGANLRVGRFQGHARVDAGRICGREIEGVSGSEEGWIRETKKKHLTARLINLGMGNALGHDALKLPLLLSLFRGPTNFPLIYDAQFFTSSSQPIIIIIIIMSFFFSITTSVISRSVTLESSFKPLRFTLLSSYGPLHRPLHARYAFQECLLQRELLYENDSIDL